jgi:hypothetical protein
MLNETLKEYRIFCFGGGGAEIAKELIRQKFDSEKVFYFDCEINDLNTLSLKNKFQIGTFTTFGKGTKGKVDLGKKIVNEDKELFLRLTKSDSLYFIVGSLGGGLFSGLLPELVSSLDSRNKKYIVVGNLPFNNENKPQLINAQSTITTLNSYTSNVLLIKNSDVLSLNPSYTKAQVFQAMDKLLCNLIGELITNTDVAEVVNKQWLIYFSSLEDLIFRSKSYILEYMLGISSSEDKVITADTNLEILELLKVEYDYVYRINPRRFEELVEYIYKLSGYKTELTQQSRDDGADVLVWSPPPVLGDSFLTVIQAKRYGKKKRVGSAEVRELIGTSQLFKADKAQLVTTSDFSRPAISSAKAQKIDLIKFYELNETIKNFIE